MDGELKIRLVSRQTIAPPSAAAAATGTAFALAHKLFVTQFNEVAQSCASEPPRFT
jgi:hypothetical protein